MSEKGQGVEPRAASNESVGGVSESVAVTQTEAVTLRRSHDCVVVRIAARQGWLVLDARELWAYRELLYFLVWRDIKVRYKQTVFGAAWAVLQRASS